MAQVPPTKRKAFLPVREVADELGISERSAWRLVEQGELAVHQFGASTRVKREDLDEYIERSRRPDPGPKGDIDDDAPGAG